jgi:hypothetical protein
MKVECVLRGLSQSLCAVLVMSTCYTLSAQTNTHRVQNVVLVHEARADG